MENEKIILGKSADTVVDKKTTITIDITPSNKLHKFLQQKGWLPKQKTFEISGTKMGTLIRISKLLLAIDLSEFDSNNVLESNYKAIEKHGRTLAECIALCIHNQKSEVPNSLIELLLNNLSTAELHGILGIILSKMDLKNFMSSIISIKGMNILVSPTANAQNA